MSSLRVRRLKRGEKFGRLSGCVVLLFSTMVLNENSAVAEPLQPIQAFPDVTIDYLVRPEDLIANQFLYQAKNVEVALTFEKMLSSNEALFGGSRGEDVLNTMATNWLNAYGAELANPPKWKVTLSSVPTSHFAQTGQTWLVAFRFAKITPAPRRDGGQDYVLSGQFIGAVPCSYPQICPNVSSSARSDRQGAPKSREPPKIKPLAIDNVEIQPPVPKAPADDGFASFPAGRNIERPADP